MNEKKDVAICKDCGKEFVPYGHGVITMKTICRNCMNKRIVKGQQQQGIKKPDKLILVFDKALCEELQISQRLAKAATKYFRTPELQALAYIVEGLEADGIGADKNDGR